MVLHSILVYINLKTIEDILVSCGQLVAVLKLQVRSVADYSLLQVNIFSSCLSFRQFYNLLKFLSGIVILILMLIIVIIIEYSD